MSPSEITAVASAVFAGISALVAAAAIYFSWRAQYNQELLNQAVLSLERAYSTLSNEGLNVRPVLADRLRWLTSARHIESYKGLKSRVKSKLHLSLCNEHEEYWRHQFYVCLNMHNILHSSYYEGGALPRTELGIDPRSAIIIYSFASWPKNKADLISTADIKKLIKECDPLKGNIGLQRYIEDKCPGLADRS